jgi:hypothetical protein
MRKTIVQPGLIAVIVVMTLNSCRKDTIAEPVPGNQPQETIAVKLQAVIRIGSIIYDSVPAMFTISSWDSGNNIHRKDTLLGAGINNITVPKSHSRFQFIINKWGITDTMVLQRDQLQEGVIYTLGGARAFKKLIREERYTEASYGYTPMGKTMYTYNNTGVELAEIFQKEPSFSDLQLISKKRFVYYGNTLTRIQELNLNGNVTGYTDIEYNAQLTRIEKMIQSNPNGQINASVEYRYLPGHAMITIDYLYSNGNAMEYNMKIKGGNNVADTATSTHSGIERGAYRYDLNINPYAHMNMPDLFLSNLSKNNLADEQKEYIGSIPDNIPYKFEYSYDSEGYPVEQVKYFKSYKTGEHLFRIKTLYFYN